jgi:hypothetical protein
MPATLNVDDIDLAQAGALGPVVTKTAAIYFAVAEMLPRAQVISDFAIATFCSSEVPA